jgi:hypothetical protein
MLGRKEGAQPRARLRRQRSTYEVILFSDIVAAVAQANDLRHTVAERPEMTDGADLSRADLRRALRALPPDRRRTIARAIREGRVVDDPRDAALAVAVARRIQATPWPRWALPRTRPHGRRAVLWLLHAAWVTAAFVVAIIFALISSIGGVLIWIVVVVVASSIVGASWWSYAPILRMRWNAPEAERRNRELLVRTLER